MMQARTSQLLGLLSRNEALRSKGFSMRCTPSGDIVIDRWGHVRGIWGFDGASFLWVSPGSSEPAFRTGNAESAVLYTVVMLANRVTEPRAG
jgi:hypothetical protein